MRESPRHRDDGQGDRLGGPGWTAWLSRDVRQPVTWGQSAPGKTNGRSRGLREENVRLVGAAAERGFSAEVLGWPMTGHRVQSAQGTMAGAEVREAAGGPEHARWPLLSARRGAIVRLCTWEQTAGLKLFKIALDPLLGKGPWEERARGTG